MGSLQQRYQDIKSRYDLLSTFDLDGLSAKLRDYTNQPSAARRLALTEASTNLTTYSQNLTSISRDMRKLLQDSGHVIQSGTETATGEAEERYNERQYPERTIRARQLGGNFFPELRLTTIPAIVAVSTFMASLSLFLIFQLLGFRGSISMPPALTGLSAPSAGALPFYKNPMVLAGLLLIVAIAAITFGILYYRSLKSKQT